MLSRSQFLAASSGLVLMLPARASAAAKVVIQYDWLMSNGQIGDVVAVKRGFFRDAGLDVELAPGGPNATAAAPVISGHAQVGQLSDSGQVMFARNSGIPIKIIAAGMRIAPFAFYSLPKNPIRSPHDMIGKRIGIQPTARYVLDAILTKNDIDPAKVAVTDVGSDMTPLAAGRIDAITGWITNAKEMSIFSGPLVSLSMESAGLPSYGDTYFATDDAIATNSDQLSRFIRALALGWDWTYQHPNEAVDIAAAEYPELDASVEKRIMPTVLRLTFDADTAREGWGTFRPQRLAAQMRAYAAVGLLKKSLRVEDVYSMKILRETQRPKRG